MEQFNGDIDEYTLYNYVNNHLKPINRRLGDFLEECEIDFKNYRYENSILILYAEYEEDDEINTIWFCIKLGDYTDTPFYEGYNNLNPVFNMSRKRSYSEYDIEKIKDLLDMNVGVYYIERISVLTSVYV